MPRSNKEEETANAPHHRPVGRASIGAQTSCVTCAIDLLPSIKGGRRATTASAMMFFLAPFCCFLRTVADNREISDRRPHIELTQHTIAPRIRHHFADLALRIVKVAKVNCL